MDVLRAVCGPSDVAREDLDTFKMELTESAEGSLLDPEPTWEMTAIGPAIIPSERFDERLTQAALTPTTPRREKKIACAVQ